MTEPTLYKFIILGGGGVGKTSLLLQLIQNTFHNQYDPTLEDNFRKQFIIDNESCILDFLDDLREYGSLWWQYIGSTQGFILTYAITSQSSYD